LYAHTLNADGTLATVARLVAAAPVANAGLGASVAASEDGTRVASGAPLGDRVGVGTDSGLATVWTLDAGAWTATDVNPPDHAAGERFGTSVAFDAGGLSLAIGSPYDTVGGIAQRGSVAVFTRSGSQWNMHDRLTVTGGIAASRFGSSVATVSGGIVVGAPKHVPPAGGTVRVFQSALVPWATILEHDPNPAVVTDESLRNAIVATGLPWRVRDNASQIEMLLVPAGTFTMGCSASQQYYCEGNEYPTHVVTLTRCFYIGRCEVRQSEWVALMGSNPSYFQGASYPDALQRPVDSVSWNMIQNFLGASGLRLPSEAEWEHAYRAGTLTAYHGFAGYPNGTNNGALSTSIAWIDVNAGGQTRPVGQKLANGFGLHDMPGNVWEWVNDRYSSNYYQVSPTIDPPGPSTGNTRVLRGGSWVHFAPYSRSSRRVEYGPDDGGGDFGFRVARDP
jgi:formylglycine-generating enzyme required for sulfatase activity